MSKTLINDYYNMNRHSPDIKKLIKKREIWLDTNTKLFKIKDAKTKSAFAKEIAGMTCMDARYIIDYHRRAPTLSPKECKKVVQDSKTNVREIHLSDTYGRQ